VRFFAVPSVPCFEFWLLLHFDNVQAYFDRSEIYRRLSGRLPGYNKGMEGTFAATEQHLPTASGRAVRLRARFSARAGDEPHTDVDRLVEKLRTIVVRR